MTYLSEFVGSFIFLLGGYSYMCNISLKNTLVSKLNYIELVVAWSFAVGVSMLVCMVFFWDSFKASKEESKRGIFSAYPVEKNIPLNFVQEILATFVFLFLVFICIAGVSGLKAGNQALIVGAVGFSAVALLALTLNSTGFSMNVMRSVFSSVWFAILHFPNKNGEKVNWKYQLIVNFCGSTIGAVLAVIATSCIKASL